MYSANELTDILGFLRRAGVGMDQVLGKFDIGPQKSLFVANLSLQSLVENGVEHMGDDGYFLFEASDDPKAKGITVLSKCCSFDAALQLVDLWRNRDD